ncbi:hypothetical protein CONPUDRAFT_82604 [Coniophora puteana RWD-64-598 SS2]|uniref:C2H2-type domain-containing protein n=1 Tax=Coniophora puteana (strain RWD-64-598) TaxID=741705 RepID=A0A5M3MNT9_CONPW|nr:uncharacterized protein CONPUDRAFT_82604 [Coniophora puteana RWD-64-598 SS2]EIW80301.1 hypothetical protein CONPUDRAFT_82604 [Coniophora puteana RWD-64-598 SS2]
MDSAPPSFSRNPPPSSSSDQGHYAPMPSEHMGQDPSQLSLQTGYSELTAALGPGRPASPSSMAFSSPARSTGYWPNSPAWMSTSLSDGASPLWSHECTDECNMPLPPAGYYMTQSGAIGYRRKDSDETAGSFQNLSMAYAAEAQKQVSDEHANEELQQGQGQGQEQGQEQEQEQKKEQKQALKKSGAKRRFHECPVCYKVFSRPSGLATHMSTHTGARREPIRSTLFIAVPL